MRVIFLNKFISNTRQQVIFRIHIQHATTYDACTGAEVIFYLLEAS